MSRRIVTKEMLKRTAGPSNTKSKEKKQRDLLEEQIQDEIGSAARSRFITKARKYMGKFKGIGWKTVVDNGMRGAYGETDYEKKRIRINKSRHLSKNVKRINRNKDGTENMLDTIVHENMHRKHPAMKEKTVRKRTKTMIKNMSKRSKRRYYQTV